MHEKILCVDDEPNILEAYQRVLKKEFKIDTATSGAQALILMESKGPYAVVVSDMNMPVMNGIEFLSKVKVASPDSVRVMLTGNADNQLAIKAVNEGNIFRFLLKPCSPDELAKTLHDSLAQYRLAHAEKDLLENTLHGCVQVMTDILSTVNPTAFGRAARVRRLVNKMSEHLQLKDAWKFELAAMLSQIGCISLPENTLMKIYEGNSMNTEELQMFQNHPRVGHDLIDRIPRMEDVAKIILYQEKKFNGEGIPHDGVKGEHIPFGARILKIALDYDRLTKGRYTGNESVVGLLKHEEWYDPKLFEVFIYIIDNEEPLKRETVRVDELQTNMILAEDVVSHKGLMLISKGQEVNFSLQMRLHHFVTLDVIPSTIQVLVPDKERAKPQ